MGIKVVFLIPLIVYLLIKISFAIFAQMDLIWKMAAAIKLSKTVLIILLMALVQNAILIIILSTIHANSILRFAVKLIQVEYAIYVYLDI